MRLKKKKRIINHLCPNCMSTLVLESSRYVCTGNRYTYWLQEFKHYDSLSENEKESYLDTIADVDIFFEMYKSKDSPDCGFSTKLSNIIPNNTIRIPDPMVIGKIELNFCRKLTDKELEEGFLFYRKGKSFCVEPKVGYVEFTVPFVRFPDDC